MTETPAQRELAQQVARLDREAKRQVDVDAVTCAQHGRQYLCPSARPYPSAQYIGDRQIRGVRCGHIACRQIANQHCPECECP